MSVVLVRIDDRLVHGQVVEGWLKAIHATHIVVASDTVAADEMQKALYLLAVPQGIQLSCLSLEETADAWKSTAWKKDRVLVLVSTPQDVLTLLQKGAEIKTVNVGGLHFKEGRVQILKAVSVNEQDVAVFKTLLQRGVLLEARPLPLDEPIDLKSYLERWQQEREALRDEPR
jgi:mannose/fructose/sorbose-specific phosphotransferase system IIB component